MKQPYWLVKCKIGVYRIQAKSARGASQKMRYWFCNCKEKHTVIRADGIRLYS